MQPHHELSRADYDGVVSALTGNGSLCTTVGPTGYHTADLGEPDAAHRTQYFVWAGRRRHGPQHPLANFGTVSRDLYVDGVATWAADWSQSIEWASGTVVSRLFHASLEETTRSHVALHANAFTARTCLTNTSTVPVDVAVHIVYLFGELDPRLMANESPGVLHASYSLDEMVGDVHLLCRILSGPGVAMLRAEADGLRAEARATLGPGTSCTIEAGLFFSDRDDYAFPPGPDALTDHVTAHEVAWSRFWSRSDIRTGNQAVDDFRASALYCLRCQATPWSIPPTVSEPYWGAGAFHDEMYPFLGLLAANHADLACRVPYFRLATLPAAVARARGRGALYPWSSTETAEERDPNGLWLTERFHLGQFAVSAWTLWLYERDLSQLDDLYPVLRQVARHYELDVIERSADGILRTRSCVDFDESVGAVTSGPFTISAAAYALAHAAEAADVLGIDAAHARRWRGLAAELCRNLPTSGAPGDEVFGIPEGKPLHYSILAPVFPFLLDTASPRALRSAAHIHSVCQSGRGWKPGHSQVFDGSEWTWTAGHLAAVHAIQGDGEAAWKAIVGGAASAGALMCPSEHIDRHGQIRVPWFTTGVGAWLYGLSAMFVRVDEMGAILLPAVPRSLPDVVFRDLRADHGVLVSGAFESGKLRSLTAQSPSPTVWRYRIPGSVVEPSRPIGRVAAAAGAMLDVQDVPLNAEPTSLIAGHD